MRRYHRGPLCCFLFCIALVLASAKYLYIHDETVWTKQSWQALKLRFPLEKLLQEKDLDGYEAISSKGAYSQETLQQGLLANKAERKHPLLEDSIQDEAQLGVVAGLVGCKVCHQLVAAVWSKGRQEIHNGLAVPSTSKINRQLWHTCEKQVTGDLLREWSILLMGSPLAAAAGNGEEGYAYVFKAREGVEAPSDFEQRALARSCTDIQEGQETGDVHFATELAQKLGDYEKVWGRLRAEAGLGPVKKAAVLEHQGTPDGSSCRDYHKQCAWWADKGECAANWRYMVGGDYQKALKGFCRFSCGACSLSATSGLGEEADARLEQESAALLAAVDAQLCAQRQPCSGLSGDAHRAMDTAKTGGAATSAGEPSPDVIAAGRNMVRAQMTLRENPLTNLDGPLQPSDFKDVLPGSLGAAVLEEVAAHCYYVSHGWWSYELCPGHHVGQFHSIEGERRIESVLSLGRYDAVQEGRKNLGPNSWPVLSEAADKLPGVQEGLSVPFIETTYSGGASCDGSDASAKRASKVQLACSPDSDAYMLVREPETCRYVVTLYHPSICTVEGYKYHKTMTLDEVMSTLKVPNIPPTQAAADREEL